MIHWANLLQHLGYFVLGLSLGLVPPTVFAFANQDAGIAPLCQSLAIALVMGGCLLLFFRQPPRELSRREGILLQGIDGARVRNCEVSGWEVTCFCGT